MTSRGIAAAAIALLLGACATSARPDNASPAAASPPATTSFEVHDSASRPHRHIVFEREPLQSVVAEFNRSSTTPIDIETPQLESLPISGTFSTDDTEAFVAFLRTIKGVHVEVTPSVIRVFQQ